MADRNPTGSGYASLGRRTATFCGWHRKSRSSMTAEGRGQNEFFKFPLSTASKLQSTMMETMEAPELEKQKHNNTRMEILTRLGKLELISMENPGE